MSTLYFMYEQKFVSTLVAKYVWAYKEELDF